MVRGRGDELGLGFFFDGDCAGNYVWKSNMLSARDDAIRLCMVLCQGLS